LAVLALAGCKKTDDAQFLEEGAAQLSTAVNVSDPRTAVQLTSGFYGVENNAWRWTAAKFTVTLKRPKEVPAGGARFYLDYTVPEVFLQKVPKATLSVTVNGTALEPEVIDKAGVHKLDRLVPADVLKTDTATLQFALDKFLAAGAVDQRELGLIVSAVGFQTPVPAAPAAK